MYRMTRWLQLIGVISMTSVVILICDYIFQDIYRIIASFFFDHQFLKMNHLVFVWDHKLERSRLLMDSQSVCQSIALRNQGANSSVDQKVE